MRMTIGKPIATEGMRSADLHRADAQARGSGARHFHNRSLSPRATGSVRSSRSKMNSRTLIGRPAIDREAIHLYERDRRPGGMDT